MAPTAVAATTTNAAPPKTNRRFVEGRRLGASPADCSVPADGCELTPSTERVAAWDNVLDLVTS